MNDLEQTRDYVMQNYERRYTVTLRFTDENVEKALEVYKFGVENCLGIAEAINSVYGYRYRRMENFLKECKLWKEGEGWLHWKVLTKLYMDYESKKDRVRVEIMIYHLAPEWLIGEHDIRECEAIFWDLIVESRMEWIIYAAVHGTIEVGDDVKQHEIGYMLDCSQEAEYIITVWKRNKITDSAEGTFELDNYRLYGELIC